MENISYDKTGKIDLNGIYNNDDPVPYFSTLSKLGYRIPEEGKPIFERLIAARREAHEARETKLIDLGCSYGVNAALLKHGMEMDDLYRLYGEDAPHETALVARDRALFAEPTDRHLEIVGIDPADKAVAYAVETGLIDAAVAANLEKADPERDDAAAIAGADLIISTGCIGYVTQASLARLIEAAEPGRPWMAHFVLRMFPFAPIEEMLAEHGYVTEKLDGVFPQRRFASPEEQAHVLDNLDRLGLDPTGLEASGWYYAELHVSRPPADAGLPLDTLVEAGERAPVHA
ncbi:MAG: methyltransferase type 12 [Alphaproteobacteria bacterium]|nr:MAG: methyltransferase type 12 [Alphaproteobacteria bacterium]